MGEDPRDNRTQFYLFYEDLTKLKTSCGGPSYGQLVAISARLAELYGSRYKELLPLTRPTLSALFNHGRKRLSRWELVASVVLSCHWHAWKFGVPGHTQRPDAEDVLATWYERHQALQNILDEVHELDHHRNATSGENDTKLGPQAARDEERATDEYGLPDNRGLEGAPRHVRGAPRSGTSTSTEQSHPSGQSWPQPPTPPSRLRLPTVDDLLQSVRGDMEKQRPLHAPLMTPATSTVAGPNQQPPHTPPQRIPPSLQPSAPSLGAPPEPTLDRSQSRFWELFGAPGLRLYNQAEAGGVEAAARVGLLLCASGYPREGRAYLSRAAASGDDEAKLLLKMPDAASRRRAAVKRVHLYGCQASAEGDIETALAYCRVAAGQGHDDAGRLLATLLLSQGDPEAAAEADRWFRASALPDDPVAHARLTEQRDWAREQTARLRDAWMPQPSGPGTTDHHRSFDQNESQTPEADTLPMQVNEILDSADRLAAERQTSFPAAAAD